MSDDDSNSDNWEEIEEEDNNVVNCLFCVEQYKNILEAIIHCISAHNFDLLTLKNRHNMDQYSYIKLINYLRKNKIKPDTLLQMESVAWNDEKYLKPEVVHDEWLMYDFDDLENDLSHLEMHSKESTDETTSLKNTIKDLSEQLSEKDQLLLIAMDDMDKMRSVTTKIIEASVPNRDTYDNKDDGYFTSYAHFGIHHDMLSDHVRTESYRNAIINNKSLFKNKIVLDLGCGTGILSMFSANAEASKVIAVDQSEIIYSAMDIIRDNDLQDTINFIHGKIEEIFLPEAKVDVIVSEWMGYFLLFEGMLDSLIYARDKYLALTGSLLPNRCQLYLTGCSDIERHQKLISFWDDVYGFKMTCMKKDVIKEASIEIVPEDKIITSSALIKDINLYTCTKHDVDFQSSFILTPTESKPLTAIIGYFDTLFQLPETVEFSTSPKTTPTHWKQTVFYLKEPIIVEKGVNVTGHIICNRATKDERALNIVLTIENIKYTYVIN